MKNIDVCDEILCKCVILFHRIQFGTERNTKTQLNTMFLSRSYAQQRFRGKFMIEGLEGLTLGFTGYTIANKLKNLQKETHLYL